VQTQKGLKQQLNESSDENNADLQKKTKQLVKKLKLKPKHNESQYSQSFIERERSVMHRLLNKTDQHIK